MNFAKRIAIGGLAVIAVAYPLIVFWGLENFEPRIVGQAIAALYFIRTLLIAKKAKTRILSSVGLALFVCCLWFTNHPLFLMLLPTVMSIGGFIVFTHSLVSPPTIPARFATKCHGELCQRRLQYTDNLTRVWMAFFLCNALVAYYTALYCSREVWVLYNGLISYMIMAALFAGEYAFRILFFEPTMKND